MARLFALILLLFLVGCYPLGYVQSPRVRNGVALGPQGSYQTLPEEYIVTVTRPDTFYVVGNFDGTVDTTSWNSNYYDTLYSTFTQDETFRNRSSWSELETGAVLLYPRMGLNDRVRFSGTAYLIPMEGFPYCLSFETMMNIVDKGEPKLFRNIAVGALLNLFSVSAGGEHEPAARHSMITGGAIVGTHQKLPHSEIEFALGTGASRHLYRSGFGGKDNYEPEVEYSNLLYTADLSPAMHISFAKENKAQFSLGATLHLPFYENFEVTYTDPSITDVVLTPVDAGYFYSVQASLSWRFNKRKK